MTYVLTPGLDAPDMLHLNPLTGKDGCGGRKWGTGDLAADGIVFENVDEKTALALLDKGLAIACRRCDLVLGHDKDRASAELEVDEAVVG